jgi:hypothetical protein
MHYNEFVLTKVRDSDWSADHIAAHDVTLDEVREAILEHPYWVRSGTRRHNADLRPRPCGAMTDAEKRTFHRKAR